MSRAAGRIRVAALVVVLVASSWLIDAAAPASAATTSRVPSAFLDLASHPTWDSATWQTTLLDAQHAGIRSVTIQSTVTRDAAGTLTSFYPSAIAGVTQRTSPGAPSDPVGLVLRTAQGVGMRVRLGLFRDDPSWIGRETPATDDAALSLQIARELSGRYSSYSAVVDGWYLPGEVSVNWVEPGHRPALVGYYSTVVPRLRALAPGTTVAISPYFNAYAGQTPAGWTSLWETVLQSAPIDMIQLQDGTGDPGAATDPVRLASDLTQWFSATRDAIRSARPTTVLWSNVDLYQGSGAFITIAALDANVRTEAPWVSGFTSYGYFTLVAPWATGTDTVQNSFAVWNTIPAAPPTISSTVGWSFRPPVRPR